MKYSWVATLLIVVGLVYFEPVVATVFLVVLAMQTVFTGIKDINHVIKCLKNKQSLMQLKRANQEIREEMHTCCSNIRASVKNIKQV